MQLYPEGLCISWGLACLEAGNVSYCVYPEMPWDAWDVIVVGIDVLPSVKAWDRAPISHPQSFAAVCAWPSAQGCGSLQNCAHMPLPGGFRWGVLDLRWLTSDCSWLFFLCPAQNDLSVPLLEEDLDGSSGLLFPVYDSDTHMLYVVGKVSAFHISRPFWFCCQPVLWQTEVKDAPEAC